MDSTLTTLTSQNILSVTSLLSNAEYSGVKGLKQLGLGTPAAWALHASLEIIRSSTALHPEPSLVEDRLNTPRDNSNEEKNSEESNQVNRRWGYTLDVDSSDGESMDDENNHTEKETSVPRTISVYSWRRKYVTVDSSSSSDDEEKDCECSRSEEQ